MTASAILVRRPFARYRARWALGAIALVVGCGGSGEPAAPSRPPLEEVPPPALCNGADLSALTTRIYVRSDGSDAGGCGTTTASACASIQKGIDSCGAAGCGVVVRHGLYNNGAAPLVLRNGVSVYGSCLFDGETGRTYRSVVNGPIEQPAVSAASITSATTFQGFVVRAGDSFTAGRPSIAMTVAGSGGLTLNQVRLVASNGAPGTKGADAGTAGAGDGGSGTAGGQTCPSSSSPYQGGNGGTNSLWVDNCAFDCDCHETSTGGTGGTGPGGGPNPGGPGLFIGRTGIACSGRGTGKDADNPGDGGGGGPGDLGVCAAQAGIANGSLPGTLGTSATWSAGTGGNGTSGGVGAGGGGGQAGGNASWIDESGTAYNGGSGGGGGGGGCGGLPGNGGQQGGASIALAIAGTIGQVDARSVMVAARGGDGGLGGVGGVGGVGGGGTASGGGRYVTLGGYSTSAPGNGGAGGVGGAGGAGSGGAGGNGGPSIGIAVAAGAVAPSFDAVYAGTPGSGGASGGGAAGGLGNCNAAGGQAGITSFAAGTFDYGGYEWSAVLGSGQTVPNNTVLTGPTTQLVMQSDGNLCLYRSSDHGLYWCNYALDGGAQSTLAMQANGNLCVIAGTSPVWCSKTDGHPGAYLALDSAGHVAVLQGSTVIWSAP